MEEKHEKEQKSEFKGNLGIIWLIGILVILLGCTVMYVFKCLNANKELKEVQAEQEQELQIVQPETQSTVITKEQVEEENKSIVNEETKNESKRTDSAKTESKNESDKTETKKESDKTVKINGLYKAESQTENYYYSSQIIISNQTNNSINFSIMAVHGKDINNVNNGEVSGTAKKINVPEELADPNAIQYAYQFIEENNKITLVYTNHKGIEYISIIEKYENDSNPYAGAGVYFSGMDYEKIQ